MHLFTVIALGYSFFYQALLVSAHQNFHQPRVTNGTNSWPYAPFYTSGRDMKNTLYETVTYAGVNWPGAADVMIPEGLQFQSIATIVSKIKSLGLNSIRLTYAIEMIDDIYESGDVSLEDALTIALGAENGTIVLGEVLAANPSFSANTTRLQVCLESYLPTDTCRLTTNAGV